MEKLLTKMGAPSYLPTPAEVIDGVRWLRENPALAAGVVVGLTSYSVAKYYEYGEESDENDEDDEDDENANQNADNTDNIVANLKARATREEIARSVSALHIGLLKMHVGSKGRHSAADSTTSTQSSLASSGGLRSRASSIFDKIHHEEPHFQERAMDPAASCLHGGECFPGKPCCDPDWGWFVPTSPSHRKS